MSYPNVARQSASLQNRLHSLLIIKANFKQLASNNITTIQELRHRATNYDSIRRAEVLTKFVDDLTDYNYSLEYLQTFIKDITNSAIGNKLIELNKLREAQFQSKLSEQSSECEALRTEMAHLDLLIKELKAEREADQVKLQQLEAEVTTLKTEVSVLTTENAEQYQMLGELDGKNQVLSTQVNALTLNVQELVASLHSEVDLRKKELEQHKVELSAQAKAHKLELTTQVKSHKLELTTQANAHKLELVAQSERFMQKLAESNAAWELKLEDKLREQAEFFKAEIAEVRGRLDNLEAQMRAMRTDTDTLKTKVENLVVPISEEDKQGINRDLANLVALSYSTVSNLQLVDPIYEQRQKWFVMLKEVFKLTKTLPRFGFNVKQHLNFMQLMFKANPC